MISKMGQCKKGGRLRSSTIFFFLGILGASFSWILTVHSSATALAITKWAIAQWLPFSMAFRWQEEAWRHWETEASCDHAHSCLLEIPSVQVQDFQNPRHLLHHLEFKYGKDWRARPLLLKNLWDLEDLRSNASRRLSRTGLLEEDLVIPYFKDARKYGALTPNAEAPIKDIVANITKGHPLKIGTQLMVQTYPELIQEVAPFDIVTMLFGDHFSPTHVVGAFGLSFLPALTTVPLFVANSSPKRNRQNGDRQNPFTALHCEPIGNVAVQLDGQKQWTLVSPNYSLWVKPTISPDGRAFFASGMTLEKELSRVPRYHATTHAGDAMWVPTWTWHRVDYSPAEESVGKEVGYEVKPSDHLAIGASLFHLRPKDFVQNNPLFAFLVIPNLLKEVLQFKTQ